MTAAQDVYLVKFGGSTLEDAENARRLLQQAADAAVAGKRVIIVHGGGPEINEEMVRRGLKPRKIGGIRVTDEPAMEAVEDVLRAINGRVTETVKECGAQAIGVPAYFFSESKRKGSVTVANEDGSTETVDLGYAGDPVAVDPVTLTDLLAEGVVPVVYTVGSDGEHHLNVNADDMSAAIAAAVKVKEMITVTDVPGILRNFPDVSSKVDRATLADIDAMIADGTISGGMLPKVAACRKAVEAGARSVRMVDGKDPRPMLELAFAGEPVGTLIVP